jgi:uncharacterized FlaG/YvyC family protein
MNVQAISDLAVGGGPGRAQPREPTPLRPVADAALSGQGNPAPEPHKAEVAQALDGVNAFLASSGSHIQFSVHEASKQMMVSVIDNDTQEVIKTIPSKELLDLAAKISELVGMLLDRKG